MDYVLKGKTVLNEDDIKSVDDCKGLLALLKHEINTLSVTTAIFTPPEIAVILTNVKMRDAMLRTFYEEDQTLKNFITWWNGAGSWLSSDLSKEQKAKVLPLLAGALLLEGRWEDTEAAIDLAIKYASEANVLVPGLAILMRRSMQAGAMMGSKQDIIKLWRESIEQVDMNEVLTNNNN